MVRGVMPVIFLSLILLVSLVAAESGSDEKGRLKEFRDNIEKRLEERRSGAMKRDADISCDDLKNNVSCERLHTIFVTCADKTGLDKGICLRKEVHPEKDKESRRNYLVVLLSELQRRVERANEKGKINDTQAAEVMAKIAEIKESALNGDSKETLKSELQDLKDLWKSIKESVKESDSEEKSLESGNSRDNGAGSDDDSQDNNTGEDSSSNNSQDDNGGENAN